MRWQALVVDHIVCVMWCIKIAQKVKPEERKRESKSVVCVEEKRNRSILASAIGFTLLMGHVLYPKIMSGLAHYPNRSPQLGAILTHQNTFRLCCPAPFFLSFPPSTTLFRHRITKKSFIPFVAQTIHFPQMKKKLGCCYRYILFLLRWMAQQIKSSSSS